MAVLKTKDVRASLCKKGFQEFVDGHHRYYYFVHNGLIKNIRTKMSHNNQDIDDYLQSQMAKQIFLSKKNFIRFATCELTEQEYIKQLMMLGYME